LKKNQYIYTGQSNLEVMQSAVNYNQYLYKLVDNERKSFQKKNIRILDFGAGIGTYADILKDRGVSVDCIEIDPNGVKVLTEKGYTVYKSAKEIKQKYDIVYSFNVLEHVEDDCGLLGDMKQCINDNGSIVIFVPAFMLIFTKLDVLVEHLRRYRKSDLRRIGKENGLSIKTLKYCDPVGFGLAFIYRFVGGSGNLNPKTIWIFDRILFPISTVLEKVCRYFFGKNVLAVFKK
jgi:SAM-dependent methyltransferase